MKGQQGLSPVYVHAVLATLAVGLRIRLGHGTGHDSDGQLRGARRRKKGSVEPDVYEDETKQVIVQRKTGTDGEPYAWLVTRTKSKVPVNPPAPPSTPLAPPAAVAPAPTAFLRCRSGWGDCRRPNPRLRPSKVATRAASLRFLRVIRRFRRLGLLLLLPDFGGSGSGCACTDSAARRDEGNHDGEGIPRQRRRCGTAGLFGPLKAAAHAGAVDEAKAKELGFFRQQKTLTVSAKGLSYPLCWVGRAMAAAIITSATPRSGVFAVAADHCGLRVFGLPLDGASTAPIRARRYRSRRSDRWHQDADVCPRQSANLQAFFFCRASDARQARRLDQNWMEKLLRLAISDYVAQGEDPSTGAVRRQCLVRPKLATSWRCVFSTDAKEIGQVMLSRYPNAKTNQPEYYARVPRRPSVRSIFWLPPPKASFKTPRSGSDSLALSSPLSKRKSSRMNVLFEDGRAALPRPLSEQAGAIQVEFPGGKREKCAPTGCFLLRQTAAAGTVSPTDRNWRRRSTASFCGKSQGRRVCFFGFGAGVFRASTDGN